MKFIFSDLVKNRVLLGISAFIFSLTALVSWSFASPVAAGPDEGYQLATIWCSNGLRIGICQLNENGKKAVPVEVYNWCYQHDSTLSASCTYGNGKSEWSSSDRKGQPNLWFKFLSFFAGNPVDVRVLIIRFVSIISMLLLSSFTFLNLNSRHRKAFTITGFTLLIPTASYLLSSAHPSGIAAFGIFSGIFALSQLITNKFASDRKNQTKSWQLYLVLAIVGALLYIVRKEAFIFFFIFGLLMIILKIFESRKVKIRILILLGQILTIGITLVLIVEKILKINLNPSSFRIFEVEYSKYRSGWNIFTTNLMNFPDLMIGNFGFWGLGALDVPLPDVVWSFMFVVYLGIIAILFNSNTKFAILFYFITTTFTVFLVLAVLQASKLYVGEELQPRYFLPLMIIGFAVYLINADLGILRTNRRKFYKYSFIFFVTLANCVALWTTFRRYTTGLDVGELNLYKGLEWWWFLDNKTFFKYGSPNNFWALGTISVPIAIMLLFRLSNTNSEKQ